MEYNWQMKGYAFACIRWIDKKKERVRWGWGYQKKLGVAWDSGREVIGTDGDGTEQQSASPSATEQKKKLPRFCLG